MYTRAYEQKAVMIVHRNEMKENIDQWKDIVVGYVIRANLILRIWKPMPKEFGR